MKSFSIDVQLVNSVARCIPFGVFAPEQWYLDIVAVALDDRAIGVARHQNSRFLELRACVSKARLLRGQDRSTDARELLMPVYRSFSEGLDTVDLREARALADRLG